MVEEGTFNLKKCMVATKTNRVTIIISTDMYSIIERKR